MYNEKVPFCCFSFTSVLYLLAHSTIFPQIGKRLGYPNTKHSHNHGIENISFAFGGETDNVKFLLSFIPVMYWFKNKNGKIKQLVATWLMGI